MRKINPPDKLEFNLEVSFTKFGEFIFKEIQPERTRIGAKKPAKEPAAIYVFPKSAAAIAEL